MIQEQMRIGVISKAQLALLYFPDQTKENALRSLKRLILRHDSLNKALEKAGNYKACHILTPKEVDIICDYLGHPSVLAYQRSFDEKKNRGI